MGIWNKLFAKKRIDSELSMIDETHKTSRYLEELKERREWLFFAILTYLRNDVFKKLKQKFSIDDRTFETKYDDIYTEMMIALLTIGLVNIKEKLLEDDFYDIIVYFTDLMRVFGMKLKTRELINADQIIDIFTLYISFMENNNEFVGFFVERMSKILSLDQEKFQHFATLNLIGMGLAYGRDAFHSVSFENIQKDNHGMRQHLKSKGDYGKNLVNFLDA